MSLSFPMERIPTRINQYKNRNIKRDAVWINNRFTCPLCFKSDYTVIKSQVERYAIKLIKHTARCNECGIQIQYNKPVPLVDY